MISSVNLSDVKAKSIHAETDTQYVRPQNRSKSERNCHLLKLRREGLTNAEIGRLHGIHATRVKSIIKKQVQRECRQQELVLASEYPQRFGHLQLSLIVRHSIANVLGRDDFDRADVAAVFGGSYVSLLRQPGFSAKHARQLSAWMSLGNSTD
jgi:hypothetical protein